MASLREKLNLLKVRQKSKAVQLASTDAKPDASSKEEKRTPTTTPTKRGAKRSPVDWRVKARNMAAQRHKEALEESPVYSIISREVLPERDDTLQNAAEQDKEEEEQEEEEEVQVQTEMDAEIDDEEEALERAEEEEAEEEKEGDDVQGDGTEEGEANEHPDNQPAKAEGEKDVEQENKQCASTDESPPSPSKPTVPSAPLTNTANPITLEETSPHPVTPPRNSSKPATDEAQSPESVSTPPVLRRHTSTSNLMIEDEASDDEKNPETQHPSDNDLNDAPVEGIVEDSEVTPQKPGEGLRLANFHRQWQMEKQIADSKPALSKDEQDMAEAVNLTEKLRKEEEALSRDAVSVAASADFEAKTDLKREATEKYIDEMFVRNDTRSRYVEEDVELTEEEKLKARALWKTRKKLKMQLEMEDENSLSRLDLFKDIDENRSTELRLKLESATRQPAKEDESKQPKRRFAWANQQPEWIKRRRVLEEKQRRRTSSVSVSKWTFDQVREKKQSTKPRSNSSNKPLTLSLGPTHVSRRKHRSVVSEKVHISSAMKPRRQGSSRRPSSFRGILGILGKQATAEKS